MVIEELESGLFLDLPLQQYIERFTANQIRDFLLCDEQHGDENLKYFSLMSYKVQPLKHKTIFNPPLEKSNSGTDSTNTGTGVDVAQPVAGTVQYRLSFYNDKGYVFIRNKNINTNVESYLFKKKDLEYWNTTINRIKKDYYS